MRFLRLITSPRDTFADLNSKPTWVLPFLSIVVVTYALNFIVYRVIVTDANFDQVARAKIAWDAAESRVSATPGQIEHAVERLRAQRNRWYLFPILGVTLSTLGISVLFYLIFRALKAGSTFRKVFSVVCWSFVVYRVLGGVLTGIALSMQGPGRFKPAPPEAWSPTSLAHLVSRASMSPNAYSALSKLDPFLVWFLVLLAIGFSVTAENLSVRRAIAIVLVCEVAYLGLNALGALPGAS